jgi:acetyl-CoA carboxylase biotin carboxyl carrier protein
VSFCIIANINANHYLALASIPRSQAIEILGTKIGENVMNLNQDDVFQILKFIAESKFNELYLEMGDLKLVVHKGGGSSVLEKSEPSPLSNDKQLAVKNTAHEAVEQKATSLMSVETNEDRQSKPFNGVKVIEEEGLLPIKSPMLGTFYTAPKPDDPPFVEVGTIVREKDTVCIIEVMKLFTSITAGIRGSIAKICAEDGQMVQYDQILFLVEPEKDSVEKENN